LERLVERLITNGVSGLFILGTTGEGPSLSYRLRRELIERTMKLAAGRVPVLVGITDTSFTESIEISRFAADKGVHSVVAATPYYFPAGQAELLEYLEDLVRELPLPLFLYNMPALTKVSLRTGHDPRGSAVGQGDRHQGLVLRHDLLPQDARRWRSNAPTGLFSSGPEELTAEAVLLGAHGGVNGGANLHPRLYVDLYQAAAAQDLQRVRQLHAQVMDLAGRIYTVGKHKSAIIKGLKCALSLLNVCDDCMAEPFRRFNEPERDKVRAHLIELGLLHT